MTFVSYAQNFEDVMLWRALKHVQNGVYVDVGAQHPVIDSVSKAFYEHGWRGVHFEPVPYYAALLRQDRPDEVVLEVALSDVEGTIELNVIADTGLSTAVDAYAQRHHSEQGFISKKIEVPTLTLKSALHSIEGKEVHWLKIDVEGLEEKVLKGWDSQVIRPWIMVVEATIPTSPEVNYLKWDPILIAADYEFVYFDGLNRFYVAKEHSELVEAFSCLPNVFDGVELSGLASSQLCRGLIASHQASEAELSAELQKAESLAAQLRQVNEQNAQLQLNCEQLNNHSQWLQNEWDSTKQRVEELSKSTGQLETELVAEQQKAENLVAQLSQANEQNSQLHLQGDRHNLWLQSEWDATKQRVEELSKSNGQLETELVAEQQKAENLVAQLSQANEQNSQLHLQGDRRKSNALWLQNEWDATKQRVQELSKSTGQLETELAVEQQKAESFLVQLSQSNEQNAHLQAHAQWLQNEWDAAKVKIDELNHCSHHWWTVADGLNQENKTLYTSRSWRITKPLRLLSLGVSYLIKGLLAIPKGIWWVIKWLIHTLLLIPKAIWWLFKWPFKLILSGLIRYAIKRPAIKLRLFTWLRKYPKAYAHTLQFARVRGINIDAMPSTITTTQQPQITETQKFTMPVSEESTTDLTSLSPRARRIYLDLKETMDSNNKENS